MEVYSKASAADNFKTRCFWKSWAMVSAIELLRSWRESQNRMPFASSLWSVHHTPNWSTPSHPKRHCYFETNFGPYNLGIRQWNAVYGAGTSKLSAKQICPNFGQIKRIKFQPGLAEVTTLIILPTKMSYHPNGTPARWLKALLQPQSPNRCFGAAWAQSGHSEVLQF